MAKGRPTNLVHIATIESKCPSCGTPADMATRVGEGRDPAPGDFSVCVECNAVVRFGEDGKLRAIQNRDELRELAPAQRRELMKMRSMVDRMRQARQGLN